MISISRNIPNADKIFIQNGIPKMDPLQQQYLNQEDIKKEIEASVKEIKAFKKQQTDEKKKMDVNTNTNDKDKDIEIVETKKKPHYLDDIDTTKYNRNRKRAKKQTLKPKQTLRNKPPPILALDVLEEGQIATSLDADEMIECHAWFLFAVHFDHMDSIKAVIMLQEGHETDIESEDDFVDEFSQRI